MVRQLPKIVTLLNAVIVGMVFLDLVLTGVLLKRRRPATAPSVSHQSEGIEKVNAVAAAAATETFTANPSTEKSEDVTAAMFLLLRAGSVNSEVFDCPSTQPSNRDYGSGTNTAQNWANWNSADSVLVHESYSYEEPYSKKLRSPTSTLSKP